MRQVIINFHGIGQPLRLQEPGEAAYWVSEEMFHDIVALAAELRKGVDTQFTFDDGNLSDLTIAAEPLAAAGYSAEVFVLSARIDTPGSLGVDDIRRLMSIGHQIGTHGANHVDWTGLDAAGETREFVEARDRLAGICGHAITSAAIPFGRYNARVLRTLRVHGYDRVLSSDGGGWTAGQSPIPRTSMRHNMTIDDVRNLLLGIEPRSRKIHRRLSMAIKRRV